MKYEVEANLLQGVLNYLATRPYGEVSELVTAILAMAKAQEPEPTPVVEDGPPAAELPVLEGEVVNA